MNDLSEAISELQKGEVVQCDCDECGHSQKGKVSCFLKPPEYLLLQLTRFTPDEAGGYRKCTDRVIISTSVRYANENYSLFGLILHHGNSISAGHYSAICQEGNAWYHFNDSMVIVKVHI